MKKKLKKIIYKSKILTIPFYIFRIFPIKKNKVICSNFYGKGYGDSPRYIADELLKENKYDIVWVVEKNGKYEFPENIRTVKINTLKYIYELVTSKVWIFNCRKNIIIKKRKKQIYIQTWHGGLALKKVEKDAEKQLDDAYIKQAQDDSKCIDYLISNGKFCTEMYKRAFWYNGKIVECGTPRNDILLKDNKNIRKCVFDYFSINENEKLVLYVPTFRDSYKNNPYDIDYNKFINILNRKYNYNYKFMTRLHPGVKNPEVLFDFSGNVINGSQYKDIQELILAADIVITDYSSTMFEAMIANKVVILYANDIDEYMKERGFYFDFKELPFSLATNNDEVVDILNSEKLDRMNEKYNEFMNNIGLIENGNASKTVCELINNECNI